MICWPRPVYTKTGEKIEPNWYEIVKWISSLYEKYGTNKLEALLSIYYHYNLEIADFLDMCEWLTGSKLEKIKVSKSYSLTQEIQVCPYKGRYGEGFIVNYPKYCKHMAKTVYWCFEHIDYDLRYEVGGRHEIA